VEVEAAAVLEWGVAVALDLAVLRAGFRGLSEFLGFIGIHVRKAEQSFQRQLWPTHPPGAIRKVGRQGYNTRQDYIPMI
jgi:hypothetical protein